MHLTRHSDYSLRVLIFLALRPEKRANIAEISTVFNVSRNHMVKVVHQLSKFGYIETTRGQGGGIELAKSATDILVGQVIRQTENNLKVINCHKPLCPIVPACLLKGALNEATEAFLNVLDSYTVADLAKNKNKLNKLLS
ncbi:MAG: Rrf2 family transcriptional regulator [Proteobacteria bacterium]|nr:Rrf2 family transcriptional regulator [Pseudomonadota bacterium]NOG59920.1 Rrf2 family transcriptional regulator [Pseudomonadota bacterium]